MEDFKEAWAHYRHLENSRTEYLKFFFTAVLGSLGLIAAISKDRPFDSHWWFLGLSLLNATLFVLTAFMYLTVRKFGAVLHHYTVLGREFRAMFYSVASPSERRILDGMLFDGVTDPIFRLRFFDGQPTSEALLFGFCIVFAIAGGLIFYVLPVNLTAAPLLTQVGIGILDVAMWLTLWLTKRAMRLGGVVR
jgi:hypothetical protein